MALFEAYDDQYNNLIVSINGKLDRISKLSAGDFAKR
jgi:hypothetical protein